MANQVRYGWEDWFQDEILGIPSEASLIKAANLRDSRKGSVLELPPKENVWDASFTDSVRAELGMDEGEIILPGTGSRYDAKGNKRELGLNSGGDPVPKDGTTPSKEGAAPTSYAGKTNVFTINPETGDIVGVLTRSQRDKFEAKLAGRTDVQGTNKQLNREDWNRTVAANKGANSQQTTTTHEPTQAQMEQKALENRTPVWDVPEEHRADYAAKNPDLPTTPPPTDSVQGDVSAQTGPSAKQGIAAAQMLVEHFEKRKAQKDAQTNSEARSLVAAAGGGIGMPSWLDDRRFGRFG